MFDSSKYYDILLIIIKIYIYNAERISTRTIIQLLNLGDLSNGGNLAIGGLGLFSGGKPHALD